MKFFKWEITFRPLDKEKEAQDYLTYLVDDHPIKIEASNAGGYEVVLPVDPLPWVLKRVPEDIRDKVLDMYSSKIREARMDAYLKTQDWQKKMKTISGGESLIVKNKTFNPKENKFTEETK